MMGHSTFFSWRDKPVCRQLLKDSCTRALLEIYKHELLANLFEELVKIHTKSTYNSYDSMKLISIKRKKVWIDFVRALERETKRKNNETNNRLPDDYSTDCLAIRAIENEKK